MKNTPLQSMIDDWFDRMFVLDKRGKTVFFPWGENKQGYLLKSKSLVAKVKKFYRFSFFVCLVVFIIGASLFHNDFWGIVGSLIVPFGGWYLAYYLYVSRIVRSLPLAKANYNEIILEKLEPQEEEESHQSDIQFPSQWNRPTPQRKRDVFGKIQHIWYRLSPGQMFMVCFFVGMFIFLIWSTYRPAHLEESPADSLAMFVVFFFWGLAGFVMSRSLEASKADLIGFIRWKLPMIVIMVVFWSFAVWFMYRFMILIIS